MYSSLFRSQYMKILLWLCSYELLLTLSVPSTMYPLIQEDNLLILPTLNCKMIDKRTRHEKASPNGFRH